MVHIAKQSVLQDPSVQVRDKRPTHKQNAHAIFVSNISVLVWTDSVKCMYYMYMYVGFQPGIDQVRAQVDNTAEWLVWRKVEANVFFLFIVMGIFPEFSVIGENLVTNMYVCYAGQVYAVDVNQNQRAHQLA